MSERRVLVVDDHPPMRLVLRMLLDQPGWCVEEAASGEEALDRDPSAFDVVVLDYRMPPGMTGLEVARHLREQGDGPEIVMCSAYLDPRVREEAGSLGIPTIDKANLESLVSVVGDLLGDEQK